MNWKVRLNNPIWWVQAVGSVLLPIISYAGLTAKELTSWSALFDLLRSSLSNPYVLYLAALSLWNAITDPTTEGLSDSVRAMGYSEPYKN
ncbi:MAG: phage holin [Eubacteriaceae bacterium]|nr:phage holin [Eubacteriaceae bacterium]